MAGRGIGPQRLALPAPRSATIPLPGPSRDPLSTFFDPRLANRGVSSGFFDNRAVNFLGSPSEGRQSFLARPTDGLTSSPILGPGLPTARARRTPGNLLRSLRRRAPRLNLSGISGQGLSGAGLAATVGGGALIGGENRVASAAGGGLLSGGIAASSAAALGLGPVGVAIVGLGAAVTGVTTTINSQNEKIKQDDVASTFRKIKEAGDIFSGGSSATGFASLNTGQGTFQVADVRRFLFGRSAGDFSARGSEIRDLRGDLQEEFDLRTGQLQTFARGQLGQGRSAQQIAADVIARNPSLAPTFAAFNPGLRDVRTLGNNSQTRSQAETVIFRLVEELDARVESERAISRIQRQAVSTIIDFDQAIGAVQGNLGRLDQQLAQADRNIAAGFSRVGGRDSVALNREANLFSDVRGQNINTFFNALNQVQGRFGLAGNENFRQTAELAGVSSFIRNELRRDLASTLNPNERLSTGITSRLESLNLSTNAQRIVGASINQIFRNNDENLSVGSALELGRFDDIINRLASVGDEANNVFSRISDLTNAQIQRDEQNRNLLNQAGLQVSRDTIGLNQQRFQDAVSVARLRGVNFDRIGFAQGANRRDVRELIGGGPSDAQSLLGEINRLRESDPNNERIPRLIEALKLNAGETRELAAVNEELSRLEQSRQGAQSLIDNLTSNAPGSRRNAARAVFAAQQIAGGQNIPLFGLNQVLPQVREIFQDGNEALREGLGIQNAGDPRRLNNLLLNQQQRAIPFQFRGLLGVANQNNPRRQQLIGNLADANVRRQEAAGALIQAAQAELQRQAELINQQQLNFVRDVRDIFNEGLTDNTNLLFDGLNQLSTSLDQIPSEITLGLAEPIRVIFPQGDVLAGLEPQIRELVTNQIQNAFDALNNRGVIGP